MNRSYIPFIDKILMIERPNLDYIYQLAGSDHDFKEKFIQIIKDEFPKEMLSYYSHIRQNEPRAASAEVNKIKDKINILGLIRSYDIASRYEEELQEGNTGMQSDFARILSIMEHYIKNL